MFYHEKHLEFTIVKKFLNKTFLMYGSSYKYPFSYSHFENVCMYAHCPIWSYTCWVVICTFVEQKTTAGTLSCIL